jgi:methionine-rich copper-binding protein CopC
MLKRAPFVSVVAGMGLLLVSTVTPVLAHAELVKSDPAAGSTVTDVRAITLTFSEPLDASKSSFKLIGPDGTTIGSAGVVSPRTMMMPDVAIGPGRYTVRWTSAATDGHIERGKFTFTVAVPAVTPAPATVAPATDAPVATDAPAATDAPVATEAAVATEAPATQAAATEAPSAAAASGSTDSPASSSSTDVLIPIIAALALVAVVGALVLRRSRTA